MKIEPPTSDRLLFCQSPMQRLRTFVVVGMLWLAALVVASALVWIVVDVVVKGLPRLSLGQLLESPRKSGREGGLASILVSTLAILSIALAVAGPMALATAVALNEGDRHSRAARWTRRSLDILSAVPSIVFGLFGYACFCIALKMGYSLLAGGLTLACMILPILTRITEQSLRAVPASYIFGAKALGLSRWVDTIQGASPCGDARTDRWFDVEHGSRVGRNGSVNVHRG